MRFTFASTLEEVPWGGSEELWSRTALWLHGNGHEVAVSVKRWPKTPTMVEKLIAAGIQVFFREPLKFDLISKIKRRLPRPPSDLEQIRNWSPDLTVISQGCAIEALPWIRSLSAVGLPFVCIHQANLEGLWRDDDGAALLRDICRSARRIYCVSRGNLNLLADQIGEMPANGEVVWNPFNLPLERALSLRWPASDQGWRAAFVARLEPWSKGQDILLRVLAQEKWRERNLLVSFYGSGRAAKSIQDLAQRLELKNVAFGGHTDDIASVWESNHLLILTSRAEGLPLALIEASMCGRPSVVTDVAGNAEICLDGKTGFVAEAPLPEFVDEALERAWSRRDEWEELGQAAQAHARKVVPENPAGDFAQKLIRLAAETVGVDTLRLEPAALAET